MLTDATCYESEVPFPQTKSKQTLYAKAKYRQQILWLLNNQK